MNHDADSVWTSLKGSVYLVVGVCAYGLSIVQPAAAQPTNLDLTGPAISSGTFTYAATGDIRGETGFTVSGSASVTFRAGQTIHLEPGFHATHGSVTTTFHALIGSTISGPVITSLSPPSGSAGTQVTIVGANFGSSGTVTFLSGIQAPYSGSNGTSVVVSVPSGMSTGPVFITAAAGTSNAVNFTSTTGSSSSTLTEYIRLGGRVIATETVH